MEFTLAKMAHLEQMCEITDQAKEQLKNMGLDQWQNGYPSREIWIRDIEEGNTWLAIEDGQVLGIFAFFTIPDPSYGYIEGEWLTGDDSPYAAVHRVCVSNACKGKGVAGKMFTRAFEMAAEKGMLSVRIDTHPGNLPMQRALGKAGFKACGNIYLKGGSEEGDLRIAFEKVL